MKNRIYQESYIEEGIGIIHEMLSDLSEKSMDKSTTIHEECEVYFGFESKFGWNILMNSIYVFQDTEIAKSSFQKFKLDGQNINTEDNGVNIGERYLRLYGILNTIYLQKGAILNLIELFKLPNKSEIKSRIESLEIIELRNKAGSHLTNYIPKSTKDDGNGDKEIIKENQFDLYEISRPCIMRGTIRLMKNQEVFENYDIHKAIIEFNEYIINVILSICKKVIKKRFCNQGKHYANLSKLENKIRNVV